MERKRYGCVKDLVKFEIFKYILVEWFCGEKKMGEFFVKCVVDNIIL